MNTGRIRRYFPAIVEGKRICTNNAATSQVPKELLDLMADLFVNYDNVHRGQSKASIETTQKFEEAYQKIAFFIGAEDWRSVILYRGTTEAINSLMYSLMPEFRKGDNVVGTYLEHNSNHIPWLALRKRLSQFGRKIEYRHVGFDKQTGILDLNDFAEKIDKRTKLVTFTGASNFLGTKQPISEIIKIAKQSGYHHPNGLYGSYTLVDGAHLVPNSPVNVKKMDTDFLTFSFHKLLAPFGVGCLYGKTKILEKMEPFQYGGDMIAEGKVTAEKAEYNGLPWKFTAGTPNIIGTILSGKATELIVDLVLGKEYNNFSKEDRKIMAMQSIEEYEKPLAQYLIDELTSMKKVTVYGPKDASLKTAIVSFNIAGQNPKDVARMLSQMRIESRASCHCATMAHQYLGIEPPMSCRISPYFYNTMGEMRYIVKIIRNIAS